MIKSIRKLFSGYKEDIQPALDFTNLKVDFHSHLIPGIDDGSNDLEESLTLIRGLQSLGFTKFITTPHIMVDGYRNTPEIISGGLSDVKTALKEVGIDVEIECAAEYFLDEGFIQSLQEDKVMTFGEKNVLFELSYLNAPRNLSEAVKLIRSKGLTPILAHPERYPYLHTKDMGEYRKIREMGVYFQANILSFSGAYSPAVKKAVQFLTDSQMIDYVATDIHKPAQLDLLAVAMREKYLQNLIRDNILLNKDL